MAEKSKKPVGEQQTNSVASVWALAGASATTIANFGIVFAVGAADVATAGIFFVAVSIITILGNTAGMGTMTGMVYFMPQVKNETHDTPGTLLLIAVVPVVAVGCVLAVAINVFAPTIGSIVAQERANDITDMLRILAPTIPLWGSRITALGATRALGSMTPTVMIDNIARPLAQFVGIGFIAITQADPSPAAFALAWAVPVAGTTLASFGSVWRRGGLRRHGNSPVTISQFWRFVPPRAVSTAIQIALERLDVILVSALAPQAGLSGEVASGVYGTLSRFLNAASLLSASLTRAVLPKIRIALASGNRAEAQRLVDQSNGWMVLSVWPYLLLLAILPAPVIGLVGSNETAETGALALTILGLGLLINPAAGPADGTLVMLGHSTPALAGTIGAFVTDLVLAIILIPIFGIEGAAAAWVAAVFIQNVVPLGLTAALGQMRPFPGIPALFAGLGAVAAVVPIGLFVPETFDGLVTATATAGLILGIWAMLHANALSLPISKIPVIRSLKTVQ